MDLINELMNCLSNIDYTMLNEDYINELLDSRDCAPFDTEWCRVDKEINALKNDQNYTSEVKAAQGKIRETAFLIISKNAGSELSAYVSDDFGLIYDSLVLNYKDEWLNKLIEKYKSKSVPTGEL